jgi:hypothetical protein
MEQEALLRSIEEGSRLQPAQHSWLSISDLLVTYEEGLPIFDTEENVSSDIGGPSTIGDGHVGSTAGD